MYPVLSFLLSYLASLWYICQNLKVNVCCFCSVTQSCLAFCDPWTAAPQACPSPSVHHPCPSPSPGVCSNSCPLSLWGHPTISSFVIPFSSCLKSFPASGSFLMSGHFTSGGQSITSASASVLPMNIQDCFSLGLTGLISLQSKGTLKSLLQHHSSKASIL